MSEEKQTVSSQDLERLLNELAPTGKTAGDEELDRALEDILGRSVSTAGVLDPVPAANGTQQARPHIAAASVETPPPQTTPRFSVPVRSAASVQEAEPEQQSLPFAGGQPSTLKLDDNPLVNEDFRRFFTTSVTPDALFSSTTEAGGNVRKGHTVTQLGLNRLKPDRGPEPEEDGEDAVPPPRAPREKGGLLAALRRFFTVEEEEDAPGPHAAPVSPAGEDPVPSAVQTEDTCEGPAAEALPVEEIFEEPVPEAAPPAGEPEASGGTVIFEKITDGDIAAAQAPVTDATTVFEPVRAETPSGAEQTTAEFEPQSVPHTVRESEGETTLFDAVKAEEEASAPQETAVPEAAEDAVPDAETAAPLYERPVRAAEDDYTDARRRQEIAGTLKAMTLSLTLRTAIVGVLAFNALYFGLAAVVPALPQPTGLVAAGNAGVFALVVYLLSLLVAGAVSWPVFKNGLPGLWKEPSADSLAALGCLGALVQNLVLLVTAGSFEPEKQLVYTVPALLALFANTLGKRMLARGVQKNFDRLGAANQTYAVAALVTDGALAHRLAHGLGETDPCLLVSRPAAYLGGFVRRSFSDRPGEALTQRLSQGLVGAAAVSGFLAILLEGSFIDSLTGVLCLGCPLTMVLSYAVPNALMNKSAEAIGTVIPGAQSVEELGQANVVVADAGDLFPGSCVQLKGLKVFSEPRIDLALLYAASLLVPNCPTLRGVFLDIIQQRTDILPEIEGLNVEVGCGYEGWADSRHLLVGNRGMMLAHGVEVPPEDYELRYTRDGRYCPVYLAVNGHLYAMFVLGYRPDPDVKEMLDEIYVSGLSLLVTGEDFNLTGERINTTYGIPSGCIKVLGAAESRQLAAHTAACGGSEGAMAHATSFKGFIAGIRIAANAAGMEKAAGILQAVAVILTALLVLVLTCTGGLGALGLPTVLLYQLAWTVLVLLLPLVKRY